MLFLFFLASCGEKKVLPEDFLIGKTWVSDSIRKSGGVFHEVGGTSSLHFNQNGNIEIYHPTGDEEYGKYKLVGDTIFIKEIKGLHSYFSHRVKKYIIKYLSNDGTSIVFYPLKDPMHLGGEDTLYFTDVSDFSKMASRGEVYEVLKNTAWYPVEVKQIAFGQVLGIIPFDQSYPLDVEVLDIENNKISRTIKTKMNVSFAIINKVLYISEDPIMSWRLEFENNFLILNSGYLKIKYRRLKKNEKIYAESDLPKKIQYDCTWEKSLDAFKKLLIRHSMEVDHNDSYSIDFKSIAGSEIGDCLYYFTVYKIHNSTKRKIMETYKFEVTSKERCSIERLN